jgi:hypothetical protein
MIKCEFCHGEQDHLSSCPTGGKHLNEFYLLGYKLGLLTPFDIEIISTNPSHFLGFCRGRRERMRIISATSKK